MRPNLKITGPGTYQEVRDAFEKEQNVKRKRKLHVVRLGFMGEYSSEEIATIVGCSKASVTIWVRKYRQGGIETLLTTHHRTGRKPSLEGNALHELIEGLRAGRWKRMKEIRHWLAHEHGISLSNGGLQYWLTKVGAALKVPRKSHAKKDDSQSPAFKEGLAEQLATLGVDPSRPFRLWVADEHRYGLISTLRRCWTLKGVRPTAPCQTKYEWGYVYGALEVMTGKSEFAYMPHVDLKISAQFLQQVSQSDPDAEHVVIWDGAGFHQGTGAAQVPANVHLIALPAYSPELNPIEQLWDQVGVAYANRVYETIEQIEETITEILAPFWQNAGKVLQLLGVDNYLLSSANAS